MRIYVSSAETGLTSKQRASIAKKSTDPKELSRLAYDNAASVRLEVFKNKNTPKRIVDQLIREFANDKDYGFRYAAANKTDDPNILEKLADDERWEVRWAVAKKTDDPNLLAKLADDERLEVRQAVAQYTDDQDILAKLADDEDPHVRRAVAKNTTDLNILAKLADDEDKNVRYAAVRKTTDLNTLAKLAEDDDKDARKAASSQRQAGSSHSTKSRRQPQSDWSIPLYSINNYSEIEGEIIQVISDAANEFARKYMGESAQVEVAPGAYDDSTGVVNIHVGENTYTVDAEDILPPATSKQKKRDCVKSLVTWMQNNLPAATDETMTTM